MRQCRDCGLPPHSARRSTRQIGSIGSTRSPSSTSPWERYGTATWTSSGLIEAVRDQDIALIVTVGRHNDPASLGPQPDNVLVHQYIPQGVLLPRCDAVITRGGAGTTLGALAFGVPLLLLPQGPTNTTTLSAS